MPKISLYQSGIWDWGQEQHEGTSQEPGADDTDQDATTSTPAPATAAMHSLYIMKPGNSTGSPPEDTGVASALGEIFKQWQCMCLVA